MTWHGSLSLISGTVENESMWRLPNKGILTASWFVLPLPHTSTCPGLYPWMFLAVSRTNKTNPSRAQPSCCYLLNWWEQSGQVFGWIINNNWVKSKVGGEERERETRLNILASWCVGIFVSVMIGCALDTRPWTDKITNAKWHGL